MSRIHRQPIKEQQLFYLLLMAGAGFFWHMASEIPPAAGIPGDPGAGFFAYWASLIIMVLLGYLLVTESLAASHQHRGDTASDSKALASSPTQPTPMTRQQWGTLLMTLVSIGLYLVLLAHIGFITSTVLFLLAFRQLIAQRINDDALSFRTLMASIVFALVATGVIYGVFSGLFKLALP